MNERLRVTLCGIPMDNPVIPSSGTFGFGLEMKDFYDLDILGSISIKGTTLHPRFGNPTPRIAEVPSGVLNSVGLQNPGAKAVYEEELPELAKFFHKPVIANIGGFSIEEYVETTCILQEAENVGWLEINISCPNVHAGGMALGTDPVMAGKVTEAVKKVAKKPVIMKLTPNVTDIVSLAKACESAGADGISLINTIQGMRINLRTRKPVLANTYGGLTGPCIFPVALRMVHQVARNVDIPVIGIGGISSASDVLEMMMAGATAVQIGAANMVNPMACKEIIEALPAEMDRYGIENIRDLTEIAKEEKRKGAN
ncbi:MAG: dihydroorotate dehydrogenase [Oscillospiraceae bacterium]|nr:dihydroorotate dehydrogenase [Oscillospiraceae bacterium]